MNVKQLKKLIENLDDKTLVIVSEQVGKGGLASYSNIGYTDEIEITVISEEQKEKLLNQFPSRVNAIKKYKVKAIELSANI